MTNLNNVNRRMIRNVRLALITTVAFVMNIACDSAQTQNAIMVTPTSTNVVTLPEVTPGPSLTPNNQLTNTKEVDVKVLCRNLNQLKKIPYEDGEVAGDPIYDGLIKVGLKAVPCLIDKVTDSHVIEDPRDGDPHIHGFTVGDAAVFMLMNITGVDEHPEAMLPPKYAKQWTDRGIYSYFAYADTPQHRKELQQWWRNWAKKNLKG